MGVTDWSQLKGRPTDVSVTHGNSTCALATTEECGLTPIQQALICFKQMVVPDEACKASGKLSWSRRLIMEETGSQQFTRPRSRTPLSNKRSFEEKLMLQDLVIARLDVFWTSTTNYLGVTARCSSHWVAEPARRS